jgi:hypothetical protein
VVLHDGLLERFNALALTILTLDNGRGAGSYLRHTSKSKTPNRPRSPVPLRATSPTSSNAYGMVVPGPGKADRGRGVAGRRDGAEVTGSRGNDQSAGFRADGYARDVRE